VLANDIALARNVPVAWCLRLPFDATLLMESRPLTSLQPFSFARAAVRALVVSFLSQRSPGSLLQMLMRAAQFSHRRRATRARLVRVIGCILLAAQRLARELDEVIGDEAHAKHGIDLTAAKGMTRGAPERSAVIRENADMQENAKGKHQRAGKVRPSELPPRRRDDAVYIGGVDLIFEAPEQAL